MLVLYVDFIHKNDKKNKSEEYRSEVKPYFEQWKDKLSKPFHFENEDKDKYLENEGKKLWQCLTHGLCDDYDTDCEKSNFFF